MKLFQLIRLTHVVFACCLMSSHAVYAGERQNGGDTILPNFIAGRDRTVQILKKIDVLNLNVPETIPPNLKRLGVSESSVTSWIANNKTELIEEIKNSAIEYQTKQHERDQDYVDSCAITEASRRATIFISMKNCRGSVNDPFDAAWILMGEATHHRPAGRFNWDKINEDTYAAFISVIVRETWDNQILGDNDEETQQKNKMYQAITDYDYVTVEKLLNDGFALEVPISAGNTSMFYALLGMHNSLKTQLMALNARRAFKIIQLFTDRGVQPRPDHVNDFINDRNKDMPVGRNLEDIQQFLLVKDDFCFFMLNLFGKDRGMTDTILRYAAYYGRLDLVIKVLEAAGPSTDLALALKEALISPDAASAGAFEDLLKRGADIHALYPESLTARLFLNAANSSWSDSYQKKLQILLDNKVKISGVSSANIFVALAKGKFHTGTISRDDYPEIFKVLVDRRIELGFDLNSRSDFNLTPLDYVAGYYAIYKELQGGNSAYETVSKEIQNRLNNLSRIYFNMKNVGATYSGNCIYYNYFTMSGDYLIFQYDGKFMRKTCPSSYK